VGLWCSSAAWADSGRGSDCALPRSAADRVQLCRCDFSLFARRHETAYSTGIVGELENALPDVFALECACQRDPMRGPPCIRRHLSPRFQVRCGPLSDDALARLATARPKAVWLRQVYTRRIVVIARRLADPRPCPRWDALFQPGDGRDPTRSVSSRQHRQPDARHKLQRCWRANWGKQGTTTSKSSY